MIMEIGRVCYKIAGRDADNLCVIVDKIDDNFVLIDGSLRRKKCNIKHLEPTDKVLKIKKDASTEEVIKAFKEIGVDIRKREVGSKEKTENAK